MKGFLMSSAIDLVVARYAEDLSWLNAVPPPYRLHVYDKTYGIEGAIQLPNVGREAHTYIHHVCAHYHKLPDYTVFCQGDPFHHLPDWLMILDQLATAIDCGTCPDFLAWGLELACDRQGRPHHDEPLPCAELYKELAGQRAPALPAEIRFNCGAQFVVHRSRLTRIPLARWQTALKTSTASKWYAWAAERMWPYVLDPERATAPGNVKYVDI
jgi:hypothetical protein